MKQYSFGFNERCLIILLSICSCCPPSAFAASESHCTLDEKVLFTCTVGKRLVSVCSSKELSRTSGYVQYRFGKKNRPLELVYPSEKAKPAGKFSYGQTGSAHSSLENLLFTNRGYYYTIYQETASFDTNGSGVRVKTPEGKFIRLKCKEDTTISNLYDLNDAGLRVLPEESLVSVENDETWPNESPDSDLLQGVRTHDFALIQTALKNGADVNFHEKHGLPAIATVADERLTAIRKNRVADFDNETDRIIAFLLAHGASLTITTSNGNTVIITLANRVSIRTVHTLLDTGWPNDYHYRLYVGALLGDPTLVKDSLNHGGDPNMPVHGRRILATALNTACQHSNKGDETIQKLALKAMELLMKAGARVDPGTTWGGGDIVTVYSYYGQMENIRTVLDMLIRYAPQDAKKNALHWIRIGAKSTPPQRKRNLEWLLKRLNDLN